MDWEGGGAGQRRRSAGAALRAGAAGSSGSGGSGAGFSLGSGGAGRGGRCNSLEPASSGSLVVVRGGHTCTVLEGCLADDPADCLTICVRSFIGMEVRNGHEWLCAAGTWLQSGQFQRACHAHSPTTETRCWRTPASRLGRCKAQVCCPACSASPAMQRWFLCNKSIRCGAIFEMVGRWLVRTHWRRVCVPHLLVLAFRAERLWTSQRCFHPTCISGAHLLHRSTVRGRASASGRSSSCCAGSASLGLLLRRSFRSVGAVSREQWAACIACGTRARL